MIATTTAPNHETVRDDAEPPFPDPETAVATMVISSVESADTVCGISSCASRYLAANVMLGVAAEAAFLDTAETFASWLPAGNERRNMEKALRGRSIKQKLEEFAKRFEAQRGRDVPDELIDRSRVHLLAVAELFRNMRNDAGHPTGRVFDREETFTSLQLLPGHMKRLHELKLFFAR